jgi:hypothetical protein
LRIEFPFASFFGCTSGFLGCDFGVGDGEGDGVGSNVGLGLAAIVTSVGVEPLLERTTKANAIKSNAVIISATICSRFLAWSEPVNESEILGKTGLASATLAK